MKPNPSYLLGVVAGVAGTIAAGVVGGGGTAGGVPFSPGAAPKDPSRFDLLPSWAIIWDSSQMKGHSEKGKLLDDSCVQE